MFWYSLIVVSLFLFQLVFTQNSLNQIRYEELAESVRNVFWLENGLVYDGISSNLGWYGTLLLIYKTFGFTLYAAKYFRLALSLISLICLAALLVKLLGKKHAWLPLITFGLSPTLLYFNVLQTSYGVDLQYLPIVLYLLISAGLGRSPVNLLKQSLAWSTAMIAWLSYPPFVYYLPGLALFSLGKMRRKPSLSLPVSLLAFLLPLLSVLAIKNRHLLWYDPLTLGGLFRGGGQIYLNWQTFALNLQRTLGDLFVRGASYNFELGSGEFSYLFPVLPVLLGLGLSILMLARKSYRTVVLLIFTTLLLDIFSLSFTFDPTALPGIRRATPLLAALYSLFTLGWFITARQKSLGRQLKLTLVIIFLLLPLHHLLAYPFNLSALKEPSFFRESRWFNDGSNPDSSLATFMEEVKKEDLTFKCLFDEASPLSCRYAEVYSAVAGSCLWNNLTCRRVLGFDEKTGQFIPLEIKLWDSYYWKH